jgi:hypothetical protein
MLCILWCLSAQEICIIYQQGFKKCLVDFLLVPSFVTRLIKLPLSPAIKKICPQGVSLMSQDFVWDFSPAVKNLGDLSLKTSTFEHCECLTRNEHQASWFNLCDGKNKDPTASFCPNTGATMSRLLRYLKRVVSNMWNTKTTKRRCIIKSGDCLQVLVQH